jgi:hypothetical protein
MKKTLMTISLLIFQLFFFSSILLAQKKCIFFYKPYTDSIETNLYEKPSVKFDYKTQYNNIKSADVKTEISNAIKHNDYRFIAISGNSYLYPGLESGSGIASQYRKYVKKYKIKVIEGTGDSINASLPPLQSVAYDYAHEYNKSLLIKIEALEKKKK